MYITGGYRSRTVSQSGYWKNGEWHTLETMHGTEKFKFTTSRDIAVAANGNVYITGTQFEGNNYYAGYWLNKKWHNLPIPAFSNQSKTTGISIVDGNVYIGGNYQSNNGKKLNPCYWINEKRYDLPVIADNSNSKYIFVSDGNVFTLESNAGYWINDIWHELPKKGAYTGIAVSGNNVYIIGIVDKNCGYWLNEKWYNLPKTAGSIRSVPRFITISGSDVYITGSYTDTDYTDSGDRDHPCYWRNGILHLLAEPAGVIRSDTVAVAVVTK